MVIINNFLWITSFDEKAAENMKKICCFFLSQKKGIDSHHMFVKKFRTNSESKQWVYFSLKNEHTLAPTASILILMPQFICQLSESSWNNFQTSNTKTKWAHNSTSRTCFGNCSELSEFFLCPNPQIFVTINLDRLYFNVGIVSTPLPTPMAKNEKMWGLETNVMSIF